LNCYGAQGDHFLGRIVTGNETWTHHYAPASKQFLRDCRFTTDRQLDTTVRAWFIFQHKTFFDGIKQIVRWWTKCILSKETTLKNYVVVRSLPLFL
jgi:Zn-dependent M16 (insulinase) family peptidase